MACAGCERVALSLQGRNPDFVATLDESIVTLADEQVYRGYCILLLKDHCDQLGDLPVDRQLRLFEDVTRVAAALGRELHPLRINYACLGNYLTHVHWHVIPRHADDPEPLHPIWVRPLAERKKSLGPVELRDLIGRLRRALGA